MKRQPLRRSRKNPLTPEEKGRFNIIAEMGCRVCGRPAEIHHATSGLGKSQRDHGSVFPLCPEHHRTGGYGVAIHAGRVKWEGLYGTEQSHVDFVNEYLEAHRGIN